MGNVHFGAEGPKVSKKIIWGWNVQNIACAASERQHPAGEYEVDNEGVNDQIGNSGIQDEGLITLLRIVSVAAMSFFLVWYIWRRLRL
ncbi:MAG TPA: hypothetical protein PKZ42_03350 [Syntrophales bacterium]|nr:hypothetical protein [Syntrophales bacterium]